MAEFTRVGNHKVKVVSAAQAERADFVVCIRSGEPSPFTDNVATTCGMCGTAIVHRPHAPAAPMKICVPCAVSLPKAGEGLN